MKAMILAAGLGTRMRPLTDNLPKPLIPVQGRPLIEYHLARCQAAGIRQVVINVSYLGHMIEAHIEGLLAKNAFDLEVVFSREPEPLDVVGGVRQALPLLGEQPFWLLSADVFTDLALEDIQVRLSDACLGHFVLVPNPAHHPTGDFGLVADTAALCADPPFYTYAGMALLSPQLLKEYAPDPRQIKIAPMVRAAITKQKVSGEVYSGVWSDVGTPERLALLEQTLNIEKK